MKIAQNCMLPDMFGSGTDLDIWYICG